MWFLITMNKHWEKLGGDPWVSQEQTSLMAGACWEKLGGREIPSRRPQKIGRKGQTHPWRTPYGLGALDRLDWNKQTNKETIWVLLIAPASARATKLRRRGLWNVQRMNVLFGRSSGGVYSPRGNSGTFMTGLLAWWRPRPVVGGQQAGCGGGAWSLIMLAVQVEGVSGRTCTGASKSGWNSATHTWCT